MQEKIPPFWCERLFGWCETDPGRAKERVAGSTGAAIPRRRASPRQAPGARGSWAGVDKDDGESVAVDFPPRGALRQTEGERRLRLDADEVYSTGGELLLPAGIGFEN